MVLTEVNPFVHETHSKDCPECRLWYAWERGQKVGKNNGQLHPSPQTIKKIQTNFAEKVREKLEDAMRLKVRFSPERDPDQRLFRCGLEEDFQEVIQLLHEGGD